MLRLGIFRVGRRCAEPIPQRHINLSKEQEWTFLVVKEKCGKSSANAGLASQ
jgi:hypothetical protein